MEKNSENQDLEKINASIYEILENEAEKGISQNFSDIPSKEDGKKSIICVIGMGYVGLPLAAIAASKGYEVFGFDTDLKKLDLIEKGISPFKEEFLEKLLPKVKIKTFHDPRLMRLMDIHIICVPTPVDKNFYPDLKPIINASRTVAQNMKKGALVILESTVNPGLSEEVVKPIFEESGHVVGQDVFISHCPERINPGDSRWNVSNIPRVVGSFDEIGLKKTKDFYESIIDAPIMAMGSIREAEAVKIMENSFRDINIAFVNELAQSFAQMDIDVTNVIRGASTKPFAFMAHWPSCGVGGHCIPVDPYYLIEKAKNFGFDHRFLRTARSINKSMPLFTVEILQDLLNKLEMPIKNTNIGILGLSYKANVGDLRESPSLELIKILKEKGANLHIFDPYVPKMSTAGSLAEILEKSDVILLATNHREFENIPAETFKKSEIRAIVDGKNCLDKQNIRKSGILYRGIGR